MDADPQANSEPDEAPEPQANPEDYPVLEDTPDSEPLAPVEPTEPPPSKLAVNARLAGFGAWAIAIYLTWQNASSRSSSPESNSEPSTILAFAYLLDFVGEVGVPSIVAILAIVLAVRSLLRREPRRGPALAGLALGMAWLLYVVGLFLWFIVLRH